MNIYQQQDTEVEERPEQRSMSYTRRSLVVAELYTDSEQQPWYPSQLELQESSKASQKPKTKCFDLLLHRLQPKPIPEFYVIGRTAITMATSRLKSVVQRLCRFIKKCSLDFQVFPEEGRVDCRALGPLSFSIWLWKDEVNDENIVLEVQRRQGCCILMQRYRKTFISYIQCGTQFDPKNLSRSTREFPQMKKFSRTIKAPTTLSKSKSDEETLRWCNNMFESESDEQRLLAMENLLGILTSNSVVAETSQKVAETIVWGRQELDECDASVLAELTFCIIGNQRRKNALTEAEVCDFEETEFAEGHTSGVMHNLALQILASSLSLVVPSKQRTEYKSKKYLSLGTTHWRRIISALCYNIGTAASRPQEATLSARCLLLLDTLSLNHEVVHTILEQSCTRIIPLLVEAQKFGTKHNDRLVQEACNLLGHIQDVLIDS